MSYYARFAGNKLIVSKAADEPTKESELLAGVRLLDFIYFEPEQLKNSLDRVFDLCISVRNVDCANILSNMGIDNVYVIHFVELLIDIILNGKWRTKLGFDCLCEQYNKELEILRKNPCFINVNDKSVDKRFLVELIAIHMTLIQVFMKSQFEYCINSKNEPVLSDMTPIQRLFLYEQWHISKGMQSLYFESNSYTLQMLANKQISFPQDASINECAELLKKESLTIMETAELPNVYALMRYEMTHIAMQDIPMIKLCANCERFFVNTGRSDKEYCPRPVEGQPDKTCESAGALLKYHNKVKSSAIIREYNVAYKRANSSMRIGNLSGKGFKEWSKTAREKRDLCLAGELSREEYTEWLNRDRIYKKRS